MTLRTFFRLTAGQDFQNTKWPESTLQADSLRSFLGKSGKRKEERGRRKEEKGKRKEEKGKRKEERRIEERGKEERGKKKRGKRKRGKRKEEKRKEERGAEKVLSVTKHGFVFGAQHKPNATLEIYAAFQDCLTFLNRHMIVWIGWDHPLR